jgi:predicted dithiol-disulfide oxidoreductase (DUF899 family)
VDSRDTPSFRARLNLADLFADRSQLIVYHFMFSPDWDEGCKHCYHDRYED